MKRILLLVGIFGLAAQVSFAQFIPNLGQPFQMAPSYNPAFTGIESYGDMKLAYRYQWVAFKDAPKYLYASFNGRIKKPFTAGDQSPRISGQAMKILEEGVPSIKKTIVGLGAQIFSESRGAIEHKGAQFNVAFHYPVTKQMRLSMGISAVIDNTQLRMDKITLDNPDEDIFYQSLLSRGAAFTDLSVRAGVLLYHPRFYAGFSYLPVVNQVIQDAGVTQQYGYYTGIFSGGYSIATDNGIHIKPSVVGLLSDHNTVHFDYSVKAYLKEKLWGGLTYRDTQSLIVIAGVNLNPLLGVSYAYERSLNRFNQFNNGSHELVLNLKMWNVKKETPYTW